jgi:hypothetical protein|tara:strand:- start:3787 stop:3966 length:180 start_codon:yes stop_codon:yes gene_type:complete
MDPFAVPDGYNAPRLIDELVPRLAAVVHDIVVGGIRSAAQLLGFRRVGPDLKARLEAGL